MGEAGRRENENGDTIEIGMSGQMPRRTEQHGGVAVVAAGVHPPRMLRMVRELIEFGERQGIHVGAQADHFLRGAGAQHADHAGPGDATLHFQPVALQFARHEVGGAVFVEGQFRVGVDVAALRRQFGQKRQFKRRKGRGHGRLLVSFHYAAACRGAPP